MNTCYSAPSRFLLRGAPDYSADTESEFHAEAHEQLRVKDLSRVPTRWFEVDSNPQPSGFKAPNIPLHHRAPRKMFVISKNGQGAEILPMRAGLKSRVIRPKIIFVGGHGLCCHKLPLNCGSNPIKNPVLVKTDFNTFTV